jgi:WD40 repeat protein
MAEKTCVRCGGFLDPSSSPPPHTCKFCGALQPLPEGVVAFTEDGLLAILRQLITGVDSTFLHPAIPQKKLDGVRKAHAAYLPPAETILALYDGTVWGSATDGFFVTTKRFGFKNQLEGAGFLEWSNVDPYSVFPDGDKIMVGSAKLDTMYGKEDEGLWRWCDAIASIALAARPSLVPPLVASKSAAAAESAASNEKAWSSVPSSWPPPPPTYSRQSFVEQLPHRPYAALEGCSVVDTQSSGHLVLACGGATVELRFAANGARLRAFQAPDIVLAARFSPSGKEIAVGGLDRKATLYDVETGRILGATPTMENACDEIVWLGTRDDGTARFAMASQRGELWIVDGTTREIVHLILGQDADYNHLGGICATTDGATVFVSLGGRLGAFDTKTGALVWRFDDALTNASRLAVSPRGDLLVASGKGGVALFDARTGQPGARFPFGCARAVAWPDSGGGLFRKAELGEWSWSPRPRFSPSGHLVALQDHVGNLAFLDTTTFALHPTPRDHGRAWIEDVAWFGDANHLVIGGSDNSLAIWRVHPLARVVHTSAIGG